tara:strand:- start:136 stop:1158 length:1023 start_codon:yes stop_codon:yes gene_type:complete
MKILTIGGQTVEKGQRKKINLDVAKLYDHTEMNIPVEVIRGKKDGPVLFICAAIHGDEINGVEIIKRLLGHAALKRIKGTLIAVPIVNVYGYIHRSRYLPDRRDLNRHFPGTPNGSLAAKIAHIFMKEIVDKSTHGIDLHTGANHRYNLPQIRACLDDEETNRLAHSFNVPVMINSTIRDGSLREAARKKNIPILLYEGGEYLRHNENVIRTGLHGVLSVMHAIDMIESKKSKTTSSKIAKEVFIARSSYWVRAPSSGSLRALKHAGDRVEEGQILGVISDPFGQNKVDICASATGIIIGESRLPLLNAGDAVFHIATFEDSVAVEEQVDLFEEAIDMQL